jgi:hypothetical protein
MSLSSLALIGGYRIQTVLSSLILVSGYQIQTILSSLTLIGGYWIQMHLNSLALVSGYLILGVSPQYTHPHQLHYSPRLVIQFSRAR